MAAFSTRKRSCPIAAKSCNDTGFVRRLTTDRRRKQRMSKVRFRIAMSLDGFVAGPEQSVDNPLGIGGMRLHEWAFALAAWRATHGLSGGETNASTAVVEESVAGIGATVM